MLRKILILSLVATPLLLFSGTSMGDDGLQKPKPGKPGKPVPKKIVMRTQVREFAIPLDAIEYLSAPTDMKPRVKKPGEKVRPDRCYVHMTNGRVLTVYIGLNALMDKLQADEDGWVRLKGEY